MTDDELKDKPENVELDALDVIPTFELDVTPMLESKLAQRDALKAISERTSYADRTSAPKMVNCQVCDQRHRGPQCKQVFAKDADGQDRMCELNTRNGRQGAPQRVNFSMPRFNQHPNKRKLAVIRIVRSLLKDEYTKEELNQARLTALKAVYGDKPRSQPATMPKKVRHES